MVYPSIDNGALKLTGTYNDTDISVTIRINGDKIQDAVVGELQDFDFWIMSSLKVTYTAGSNISISMIMLLALMYLEEQIAMLFIHIMLHIQMTIGLLREM